MQMMRVTNSNNEDTDYYMVHVAAEDFERACAWQAVNFPENDGHVEGWGVLLFQDKKQAILAKTLWSDGGEIF